MRAIALAIALTVGIGGVARAEPEDDRPPPTRKRRALALTAAVVPGALVHGSGHYVLGDRSTAWRLLKMEGVGLGLMAAGGGLLGLSGTDDNLAALYVPLLVSGLTVFAGSFLADLLGVSGAGSVGEGSAALPAWLRAGAIAHTALGYRYVYHPGLEVTHVARASAAARAGKFRIAATAETQTRGQGFRAEELALAYRLPWRPLSASSLDLGVDAAHRALPAAGVTSIPVALWAEAMWNLEGLVPRLPGAYARARLGMGVEMIGYSAVDGRVDEAAPFLVANAGMGLRLGPVDAEISYAHRQDGFPGGGFYGRLPGMLGSVGAAGRLHLTRGWALTGEARYGTGLTTWLAIERSY